MRSIMFILFFLLLNTILKSQPAIDINNQSAALHFRQSLQKIQTAQSCGKHKLNLTNANDLVVGYPDPNEIKTISGDYYLDGDVTIVNRGILNIDAANFKLNGDIFIIGEGQMNVNGGNFTLIQEYIYEHKAAVIQSGTLKFSGVKFSSSGQSWNNVFADSAHYIVENSEISDGFITTVFAGKSTGTISNTYLPGEYLCFEKNVLKIKNCDMFLVWLVLSDSSYLKTSLPGDSLLNFRLENQPPHISGIAYTIEIDSCTNAMWGLISSTGSEATFSDTEFRTIGLMFNSPDSIIVSNIVNESFHTNDIINIPDRELHLINSEVHTWSFYPSSNSNITVQNCLFGELLAQDSSTVTIANSYCDGSGGYLGAFHKSFLLVISSFIKAQVISRQSGILVAAESALWGSEIDADESSAMFLANSAAAVEPQAHHSAVIFEAQCPPVEGFTNDFVTIVGTARLLHGPDIPIEFNGYGVYYSPGFDQPNWQLIEKIKTAPVKNDTLVLWDTYGRESGNYALQVTLFHSFGEPISMVSRARLEDHFTPVNSQDKTEIFSFDLFQNYPNPFNASTKFVFTLDKFSFVSLDLFDIQGRKVDNLAIGNFNAGKHSIDYLANSLPSGVYFYRLKTNEKTMTKKLLLIQ